MDNASSVSNKKTERPLPMILAIFATIVFMILLGSTQNAYARNIQPEIIPAQEAFFNNLDESITELYLYLDYVDDDSMQISPAIQRLKNLRTLTLIPRYASERYIKKQETEKSPLQKFVNIPYETLMLPNLEELTLVSTTEDYMEDADFVYDETKIKTRLVTFRLRDPKKNEKINMKSLTLSGGFNAGVDFLKIFQNLEVLTLKRCYYSHFPNEAYSFRNLRRLTISGNNTPISFDDRLCEFSKLEEIDARESTVIKWPACIKNLTSLKTLKASYAGPLQKIGNEKYYFPVEFLDLPNLENFVLTATGRLELPPRGYGLHKLKNFQILDPRGDMFSVEPPLESFFPETRPLMWTINLDNLPTYSSLESIQLEWLYAFFDSTDMISQRKKLLSGEKADNNKETEIAIARLSKILQSAYDKGMLPNLKVAEWVLDPDDSGDSPHPVLVNFTDKRR